MNNKTIKLGVLLFGFFCSTLAFSQPVSKAVFEDLVDEIICDFTDLSLKEQNRQPHYKDFKKTTEGKCDFYSIRPFLRERKLSGTEETITLLHEEYKAGYNARYSKHQLYSLLQNLFDEQKIVDFSANHASSYSGFKSDLDELIRAVLRMDEEEKIDSSNITILAPPVQEAIEPVEEKPEIIEQPRSLSANRLAQQLLFWGLLLLLLAIIAYFVYGYWKQSQDKVDVDDDIDDDTTITSRSVNNNIVAPIPQPQTQSQIDRLRSIINGQQDELESLRSQIKGVHLQLNTLQEQMAAAPIPPIFQDEEEDYEDEIEPIKSRGLENEAVVVEDNPEEVLESIPETLVTPEVFFMPIPTGNGIFNQDYLSPSFVQSESVYRFELLNPSEAKFTFYNDEATVRRALNSFQQYVLPACKALNDLNLKATKIITQVPGTVYKDGSEWKLKEKALIYYE